VQSYNADPLASATINMPTVSDR